MERGKDESCALFPDKKEHSVLVSIAFGGARLSYTAWRFRSSWLVLSLKTTFAAVKGEMYLESQVIPWQDPTIRNTCRLSAQASPSSGHGFSCNCLT